MTDVIHDFLWPQPRASRSCSRGRRVEKLRPPHCLLRPAQVRDLRGGHAAGALYRFARHASPRSLRTRRTPLTEPCLCSRQDGGARNPARRAGSGAGAMRSVPLHREAGKRARRFLAASSACVIRVVQRLARRIGAPGICRPHASVLAATSIEFKARAVSRHA